MANKDNKLKDLTPLSVNFTDGESPTSQKLEGMMVQAAIGLKSLEYVVGDIYGEDPAFNTWLSSLARDIGDRSEINPTIAPNFVKMNYVQGLTTGRVEHELDFNPVGDLSDLVAGSTDISIIPSQWKTSEAELKIPGDWTVGAGYIENGKHKRSRKLTAHAPSSGGTVVFREMTSGRGSSLEEASDNVIPSIAQAEDEGPFCEVSVADAASNTYLITLPLKTKMYDKTGQSIDFSASNSATAGSHSQYELPPFFFEQNGLDLESDEEDGGNKIIPLNLVQIYDWATKKRVEGIVLLKTTPVDSARRFQLLVQYKPDVLLDINESRYMIVVPGNTITQQLKALSEAVYNNTRNGQDMLRLISHNSLLDLRSSTVNSADRSSFYGTSSIDRNDHSMYVHRNGFTDGDGGAGANILRGSLLVGNTNVGPVDTTHEHMNLLADSFKVLFGNKENGGTIGFEKVVTQVIDHAKGNLTKSWTDNALVIEGSLSDANGTTRNTVLEGNVRTTGDVVLGSSEDNTIFIQGKTYINDEVTLVPRSKIGVIGEEGKTLYDEDEKALIFYNGTDFVSPWKMAGNTVVIGDGVKTFGKFNGKDFTPFAAALADVSALGGHIKVLDGEYNFEGNTLILPVASSLRGSKNSTIKGTANLIQTGSNCGVWNLKLETPETAVVVGGESVSIDNLSVMNAKSAVHLVQHHGYCSVGADMLYTNVGSTVTGAPLSEGRETLSGSVVHFPHNSGGCLDWSEKSIVLREFVALYGAAVALNRGKNSGWGQRGCLEITGTGGLSTNKYLPVSPNLGIGGHINIRSTTGNAFVSVGVSCYNQDYNALSVKWLIIENTKISAGTLENNFFKGIIAGAGAGIDNLPVGTRFVKPFVSVHSNTGMVEVDNFDIFSLGYSRTSLWG